MTKYEAFFNKTKNLKHNFTIIFSNWFVINSILKHYLFFVMEFINGYNLFYHKEKCFRFSESQTRICAAQIVCGLQFLHSNKIIHRFDNIVYVWGKNLKLPR